MNDERPVVIVGGGPAATATALHLHALRPAQPILVVAALAGRPRWGETLTPAVAKHLHGLGLWRSIRSGAVEAAPSVVRWQSPDAQEEGRMASAWGSSWHVDRDVLDQGLRDWVGERGISILDASVVDAATDAEGVVLSVRRGGTSAPLRARVVVDATGRASRVARALGASRVAHDRLVACWVQHQPVRDGAPLRQQLEAVEEGWWYAAPLPGDRLLTALFTDADLARLARLRDPLRWREALAATHLGSASEGLRWLHGPHIVAAGTSALTHAAGHSWLAVGDAAATLDPLCGQGVLWALRTAAWAAHAACDLCDQREDAAARYTQLVAEAFTHYLAGQTAAYAEVKRWPDAPFWKRRTPRRVGATSPAPAEGTRPIPTTSPRPRAVPTTSPRLRLLPTPSR